MLVVIQCIKSIDKSEDSLAKGAYVVAKIQERTNYDDYTKETESPPAGDLRQLMAENPLPQLPAATVAAAAAAIEAGGPDAAVALANTAVQQVNAALAAGDTAALAAVFFAEQAFFRDQLILTYETRTFSSPKVAAAALLETTKLRQLSAPGFAVAGPAMYMPAMPTLAFVDASFTFHTDSPKARGNGRVLLLPVRDDPNGPVSWKIWIWSTYLDIFDGFVDDENLLKAPVTDPASTGGTIETDVIIIGGGNAGVILGARLKALGVNHLVIEKNARPGDNWARRYDCLQFHICTSFCEMPYLEYDKTLQTPHLLTRDELAAQVRRFVDAFPLPILYQTTVTSTRLDTRTGTWTLQLTSADGTVRTVVAKNLVQATGLGSQVPNKPTLAVDAPYTGTDLHSHQFTSAQALHDAGARSVAVIGSANTAFDVLTDCVRAGLAATMVVRSPTYLVPVTYICDPRSLGLYDVVGVAASDHMFLTLPAIVDGQLSRGLFAAMAAAEPDRYAKLAAAGFPVFDSHDPSASLMHNLLEAAGGHYVDVGGSDLIADGRAGVRGRVAPVAYTARGLRLSDGSTLEADAIVWCTGFADKDVRHVAASVLGSGDAAADEPHVLGPAAIAARLDASWGVDGEGEVRGTWKRHSRVPTYWVMGGYTQQHRAFSRTLAQQLKASVQGILPAAYRGTPV